MSEPIQSAKLEPTPAVNDAPLPSWQALEVKAATFSFLAWLFLFAFVVGFVAVLMMSLPSWAIGSSFNLVCSLVCYQIKQSLLIRSLLEKNFPPPDPETTSNSPPAG